MSSDTSEKIVLYKNGKSITVYKEELEEYKKCTDAQFRSRKIFTFLGSLLIALAVPFKDKVPQVLFAKRAGVLFCSLGLGVIYTKVASAMACLPELQKIVDAKSEESRNVQEESLSDAPTDEHKYNEPNVPTLLGDMDFSQPLNISGDWAGSASHNEVERESKYTTYKELRNLNRKKEDSKFSNQINAEREEHQKEDEIMGGDESNNLQSKRVTYNSYGDKWEW